MANISIRSLYAWAKERGALDLDIIIPHRDGKTLYDDFDTPNPQIVPCPKKDKYLTKNVVRL